MAPGDTNVCTTPICPSKTGEILQLLEGVKNTERTPCIFGVNEMNTKVNDENVKALLERAKIFNGSIWEFWSFSVHRCSGFCQFKPSNLC